MKTIIALLLLAVAVHASTPISATYGDVTFVVRDAFKNSDHPFYGQGFPVGYVVNGSQGPELILTAGNTYTFVVNSLCNHPFYFTSSESGQSIGGNATEITTGVSAVGGANIFQICGGATVQFTPPQALIGSTIYYQCRVHSKMGFKITIRAQTFCDKYAQLLGFTDEQLVSAVVTQVFTQVTDPRSPLLAFFDGTYSSANFTDSRNAAQISNLANHLIQFFGIALGCTDPAYPPYTGNTDMRVVHAAMPIGTFEFDTFNGIVAGVLSSNGVTAPDVQAAAVVLNSLQPAICNQASDCKNSICDRYSRLLNITNVELVSAVVTRFVTAALSPGFPLKPFFDGTTPAGSTDFSTNTAAAQTLGLHLVEFFGQQGVLTCTDPTFPAYQGDTDLARVHAAMPIGTADFATFVSGLDGVLASFGVAQTDIDAVNVVLASTKPQICNQPDCTGAAPTVSFAVDVVIKTNAHPQFNVGFSSGFRIDGEEGRELFLQPGQQYSFVCAQSCVHPLYITNSSVGASLFPYTDGVTFPAGNPLACCQGAALTFKPSQAAVGTTLYYNCQVHMNMGWKIHIGQQPTQVTTGVPPVNTTPVTTGAAVSAGGTTTAAVTQSSSSVIAPSLFVMLVALLALL